MRRLVNQCINLAHRRVQYELLRKQGGAHATIQGSTQSWRYGASAFLQQKQHGVRSSRSDRQLIELMTRHHLPREVSTLIAETVLKRSEPELCAELREKVAFSWVRLGIDIEKAQKQAAEKSREERWRRIAAENGMNSEERMRRWMTKPSRACRKRLLAKLRRDPHVQDLRANQLDESFIDAHSGMPQQWLATKTYCERKPGLALASMRREPQGHHRPVLADGVPT